MLTGGIRIDKYHLKIIDYAIKNNIPILGICCGMQAMAMYSLNNFNEIKVLEKIDSTINHNGTAARNSLVHQVKIKQDSWLFKIFDKTEIEVNSYHNFKVKKIGKNFDIIAKSKDNIIEAIEYKNKDQFVLGVQWHPELLSNHSIIFQEFIRQARKYNENKCRKYSN